MSNLITKKGDEYLLTPEGEYLAYWQAMYQMGIYYIQQVYPQRKGEIPELSKKFSLFLKKECPTIHSFLDKLPQIASFLGEKNPQKFIQYVSKYFPSYVEKIKKSLLEKELPRFKAFYEDPYRTPGKELLLKYEELFLKAKPLGEISQQVTSTPSSAEAKNKEQEKISSEKASLENLPGKKLLSLYGDLFLKAEPLGEISTAPSPKEETPQISLSSQKEEKASRENLPGKRLLELYEKDFLSAEKLRWEEVLSSSRASSSVEETTSVVAQEKRASPLETLPGKKLLEKWGPLFERAKALVIEEIGKEKKEEKGEEEVSTPRYQVPSYSSLYSLYEKKLFFQKNQDTEGYKKWFSSLSLEEKLTVYLMPYIFSSLRGKKQEPPWEKFQNYFSMSEEELKAFWKEVYQRYHYIFYLKSQLGDNLSLFKEIWKLVDKEESAESKKTALGFLLLQIPDPQKKEKIEKLLLNVIV